MAPMVNSTSPITPPGHHHQPVRPRVLQPEQVREAHRSHPRAHQGNSEDGRYALVGGDQAHPPRVGELLD
jgi:hypothetical protein